MASLLNQKKLDCFEIYYKGKKCAQEMESFTTSPQTHKKESNFEDNTLKHVLPTPPTTISPIVFENKDVSQSGGYQTQKCAIIKLCNTYLQIVAAKSPCEFNAKELILDTNIKQRRVYDLMNILEGCGYVKRISKGKYQSFDFEEAQQLRSNHQIKVQEICLSSMAFHVKRLLIHSQGFKPIKEISSELFNLYISKNVKLKSLRRRVYEVCKVLTVLGIVLKRGSSFKWRGIYAQTFTDQSGIKSRKKVRIARTRQTNKQTKWQIPIINKLLDKISNEDELNTFIQTLRTQFQMKMQPLTVNRQLNYD